MKCEKCNSEMKEIVLLRFSEWDCPKCTSGIDNKSSVTNQEYRTIDKIFGSVGGFGFSVMCGCHKECAVIEDVKSQRDLDFLRKRDVKYKLVSVP